MSVGNFGSFVKAAIAACIVCAAVSDGNAATSDPASFGTVPFVAPASPADIDAAASTSFKERFEVSQPSHVRDMLASLTYYVPQTELTTASLPRHQKIVAAGAAIVGIASTYNPTDPTDKDSGTEETASGEKYDANDWTAAIRTDLRAQFGGVRFGKNYQPAFALVEIGDKQAIVRINDIGPLKPGRIIDLNERTMRYFDPTAQVGIIDSVKVTPLAGQEWALGPLDDDRPVNVASRFDQVTR